MPRIAIVALATVALAGAARAANPAFGPATTVASMPEEGSLTELAVGDVNGDGNVDLYVGNLGDPPAEILLNDGTGHFTKAEGALPPGGRYTRSLFLDVDRDGHPDLVLGADNQTAQSIVLHNDGHGRFSPL